MGLLFNVIAFNVWDIPKPIPQGLATLFPYIFRILAERITRQLSKIWSLVVTFTWIFGLNADRIKVEIIFAIIRVPKNHFVSTAKPMLAMQAVPKTPHDAVPKNKAKLMKDRMEKKIEGVYATSIIAAVNDLITYLPAKTSAWFQSRN